jgi:hypothetical protein
MWDPPDVIFKGNAPLAEDWGGSGGAYALVAGALNFLLSGSAALHRGVDLQVRKRGRIPCLDTGNRPSGFRS